MALTVADALQLAVTLHRQDRPAEAGALYRAVLRAVPDHPDALHLLAAVLRRGGQTASALTGFAHGLAVAPAAVPAWRNYALLLADLGRTADAAAALRRAALLAPLDDQPWIDLGNALMTLQRPDAAASAYRHAAALSPDRADGMVNLGVALRRGDRLASALRTVARGVRLRPDDAAMLGNYGNALLDCGRPDDAAAVARRGLALDPVSAACLVNLGNARKESGRPAAAERFYRRVLVLDPGRAEAGQNLGMALLQQGRFAEGWRAYERRLEQADWPYRRDCPQPEWRGDDPVGRTILVHAEQGFGDTLHFIRYLPHLRRLGARVIFEPQRGLARLLAGIDGVDDLTPRGDPPPPFDAHVSLLSLPHRLGRWLTHIPAEIPYLAAEPARRALHRRRLAARPGLRVGVAWQGNPDRLVDRGRSVPVGFFARLGRLPGVRLHCLQRVHGLAQLADWPVDVALEDVSLPVDGDGAFVDTAAIMAELDLIIVSDSAAAHLAGALGRPVWVALQAVPEWRFQLGRTDSPWYPTMRLFRQARSGDWDGVFVAIADALSELIRAVGVNPENAPADDDAVWRGESDSPRQPRR
jgi:tetratricopeptide (TPR) repeat protein